MSNDTCNIEVSQTWILGIGNAKLNIFFLYTLASDYIYVTLYKKINPQVSINNLSRLICQLQYDEDNVGKRAKVEFKYCILQV